MRARQPWKAAHEHDFGWLGSVVAEHYAGDDTNARILGAGVLAAFADLSVDDFAARSDAFLRSARHPTLGRGYLECAYAPVIELLQYMEATASPTTSPPAVAATSCDRSPRSCTEFRASASSAAAPPSTSRTSVVGRSRGQPQPTTWMTDPEARAHLWSRTGRRPVVAAGNSNGDIQMLDYTQHDDRPSLRPE